MFGHVHLFVVHAQTYETCSNNVYCSHAYDLVHSDEQTFNRIVDLCTPENTTLSNDPYVLTAWRINGPNCQSHEFINSDGLCICKPGKEHQCHQGPVEPTTIILCSVVTCLFLTLHIIGGVYFHKQRMKKIRTVEETPRVSTSRAMSKSQSKSQSRSLLREVGIEFECGSPSHIIRNPPRLTKMFR